MKGRTAPSNRRLAAYDYNVSQQQPTKAPATAPEVKRP